jgi:hypothetical protein
VGTEGEVHSSIPPRILGFRLDGTLADELEVPDAYLPGEGMGVRSNHGFEGLSISPDGSTIIAAVENALIQDGPPASLDHGTTVRLLIFNHSSRSVSSERVYRVEPVPDEPRPPTAYRSIGVSEILALDPGRVLVVERSFSAGVGNRVRIYLADLDTGDDVTGRRVLPEAVEPVRKTLLADLHDLGIDPDNLEGLTFGPVLADGRPSLVMVADNNFQPEVQANQLLVLSISGVSAPSASRPTVSVNRIQAADHVSPLVGRCVEGVEGTVTAILGRKTGQAFWIQQTPGDHDPRTSEGLFITALEGTAGVEEGDAVRLTGRVEERVWGMELPVTRLVADGVVIVDRGLEPPPPVVMGLGGRMIPTPTIDDDGLTVFEPETDAIDYFESLEGMRVRVDDPVVVGPTSRHGEIVVLGDRGVGVAPRSGRGGVVLQPGNAHPQRITIDDRLVGHPPSAAVGDTLENEVVGVLHYSYGSFKLLNAVPLEVSAVPARSPSSSSLVADGSHITVASFNVENLSAVSDDDKQAAVAETIVQDLGSPTMVAVQEIQDDSGPEDDGVVGAGRTLGRLVEAVVDAGGPRYRWSQIDPDDGSDGGRPGANIRSALLYDPARAELVGAGSLLSEELGPIRPDAAIFVDSRKPLIAKLRVEGEPVFFVVCHLRSKGGDDPLFGRRQPPVRSSENQRLQQAQSIRTLVDALLDGDPDAMVVVLGDLNDFEFSDAVKQLAAPPMVNLMSRLTDAERSTYVYRGNSQTLDHIIVSPALAHRAEIEVVHVNADLPASSRASDHDPVIARIKIGD